MPSWFWYAFGLGSVAGALSSLRGWRAGAGDRRMSEARRALELAGCLVWSVGIVVVGCLFPDVPAVALALIVVAAMLMVGGVAGEIRRGRQSRSAAS